jgi:hypothetical protein
MNGAALLRSGRRDRSTRLRRENAMKALAILVTIAAVATATSAFAAPATHQAGAPVQQGKYCWVPTGIHGSGWWDLCDTTSASPRGRSLQGRDLAEVESILNGGGGGGGGGGGR